MESANQKRSFKNSSAYHSSNLLKATFNDLKQPGNKKSNRNLFSVLRFSVMFERIKTPNNCKHFIEIFCHIIIKYNHWDLHVIQAHILLESY
jgi:hypothetical protein